MMYVKVSGAVTALGHDVRRTIASLRSGLDRLKIIPFQGASEQDLQAAPIEGYAEGVAGVTRYKDLALKALRPCLEGLSESDLQQTAVFVGLPRPNRPGVPEELAANLRKLLASSLHVAAASIRPVSLGRPSVFFALREARELLVREGVRHCVVGGVDSLVNGNSLRGLSTAGLLKEEWDGFIPGEAAAFLRLVQTPEIGCWGRPASAIAGIGVALEEADGTTQNPLVGVGISKAFQLAMCDAGLSETEIKFCINDVNGARAAFEDEAFGRIRFLRSPRQHFEVWHPASYMGEIGAAVGAIELIWGSAALELGFAPGPGLLASSSEADLRTAVFLKRMGPIETAGSRFMVQVGIGSPILHSEHTVDTDTEAEDPGLYLTDVDNLHGALVRENFSELSWLVALREHHHRNSEDPWADIEGFEQRLVAHLDALAWSGPYARDMATEVLMSDDMEDVAAAAMLLLSFPVDRNLRELLDCALAESQERCQAIVLVLPHMPRENAEPILFSMLSSMQSFQIVNALRAMTISRWTSQSTLQSLVDRASIEFAGPLVEAAGAACLMHMGRISNLIFERYLDQIATSDYFGPLVISPKHSASTIIGIPRQQFQFKAPIAYALNCLSEGISFLDGLPEEGSLMPEMLEAIGWSGESLGISLLLTALDSQDKASKLAAANALHRICGISCYEEIQFPAAEGVEGEDGTDTITVKRLSQSRLAWEEALGTFRGRQAVGARFRHGQPWTTQSSLVHLQRSEANYWERMIAAWEYAIVNRRPLPLHPLEFVRRQRQSLRKI